MANRTCEHCPNQVLARGWCSKHYQAWSKYGDPLAGGTKATRGRSTCKIETCGEPRAGLGWCSRHYNNYRRHGDPEWVPENPHRKYALDDHFFDVIDTEAKAYWLGFVTADGCVRAGKISNGWNRHELFVKLKESDAGHLEKLKAALSAQSPVRRVPRGAGIEISLSSGRLVESLMSLGVTPRKSLTVEPWAGPVDLMRHYWRGLFDGDGSIGRSPGPRDKWRLTLCGTKAVVEAFRDWAAPVCGSAASSRPQANIWKWTAAGLESPQLLARELYGGSSVHLDRKYELALQLMAAPVRHRSWLRPAGAV